MRRLRYGYLGVLLSLGLIAAATAPPPAAASHYCQATAYTPWKQPGTVHFTGNLSCSAAGTMFVHSDLQKLISGTWYTLASGENGAGPNYVGLNAGGSTSCSSGTWRVYTYGYSYAGGHFSNYSEWTSNTQYISC
jgi:hypothetical protein